MRNLAICSDLDDAEIDLLNGIGRKRSLRAGEQLLWEGDEAVLVANVVDGLLKLSTATADGREQIVGLAYPSDFIGRPFGAVTPYDVTALSDAVVCVFRRADFDRFAREHPRLEHKLLERTLTELDRSRRWILLLGRLNAEEKVATFILEMAERLGPPRTGKIVTKSNGNAFRLPLSRQQIGDVLGLTIETVSRQISRLKEDGIVTMPNRRDVVIADRDALLARTG